MTLPGLSISLGVPAPPELQSSDGTSYFKRQQLLQSGAENRESLQEEGHLMGGEWTLGWGWPGSPEEPGLLGG